MTHVFKCAARVSFQHGIGDDAWVIWMWQKLALCGAPIGDPTHHLALLDNSIDELPTCTQCAVHWDQGIEAEGST